MKQIIRLLPSKKSHSFFFIFYIVIYWYHLFFICFVCWNFCGFLLSQLIPWKINIWQYANSKADTLNRNIFICFVPFFVEVHSRDNFCSRFFNVNYILCILSLSFQFQIIFLFPLFLEKRQTMLFSATQTKKVEDLAKVSLHRSPLYVGVDDDKTESTVDGLEQVKLTIVILINLSIVRCFYSFYFFLFLS